MLRFASALVDRAMRRRRENDSRILLVPIARTIAGRTGISGAAIRLPAAFVRNPPLCAPSVPRRRRRELERGAGADRKGTRRVEGPVAHEFPRGVAGSPAAANKSSAAAQKMFAS